MRYGEINDEHRRVREKAGLFDVSHMGEIDVRGPEAQAALNHLLCNDVRALYPGKAHYSAITNPDGGLVDDIIVYMRAPDHYMLCVNAANTDKDFAWLQSQNKFKVEITNISASLGQLAVQGPAAVALVASLCPEIRARGVKRFHFIEGVIADVPVTAARTGYTGEDGFELFVPWAETPRVWDVLLERGAEVGLAPIGLGARDSLRLEACYPLYGHELRDDVSVIESGLGWIVKLEKGEFVGRGVLAEQAQAGAPRSLIGFIVEDPGIVREKTSLYDAAGELIGEVTSGMKTPTLNRSVGMALVQTRHAEIGSEFFAEVRGRRLRCRTAKRPLYAAPKPH